MRLRVLVDSWFKLLRVAGLLALFSFASPNVRGALFDGGVDSANLGKGEWIYVVSYAVNQFSDPGKGPYVPGVNSVSTMMSYMKNTLHVQFIVVKAGSGSAYYPSQASPQFTPSLVTAAHAQGLKIFGYTLSSGADVPGETSLANYVFNCGADGFVLDAEGAWETLANKDTLAWQLCGAIKTNWPTKFLAHSPFANYSSHSAFPYKEFGYWCDAVMPQVYWVAWGNNASPSVNQYRTPALGIQWMDSNFSSFQNGLSGQGQTPPTYKHPSGASWTNAIKPLAPIGQADTPGVTNQTYADMTNFVNYLKIDPTCVTAGGYKGCVFYRPGLQDEQMLKGISVTRIGVFDTPPSITGQPSSRTNNAGTTATFNVVAAGSTPFTYQWRKNNVPLSDTPGISGSASATLTTSSVLAANVGDYTVVVSNSFGSEASSTATLSVIDPFLSVQPNSQTRAAGGTVTFSVTAAGTPPLIYQWQKDNAAMSETGNISGTTTNSLNLINLGQIDQAGYSVIISNSAGSITSSIANLTVTGPPSITLQPQSQIAIAGTNVTFTVAAIGDAPLYYQWYSAGGLVINGTSSSLTLSNAQPSLAGNYWVVITNNLGTITSSNALLSVHYTLTATVSGGGSISQSPSQTSYAPDSIVTVTAIPNAGCSFLNWSGDASGSTNPLSMVLNGNKSISAEFSTVTPVEDIVIVESRGGGSNYSAYADTNFFDVAIKSSAAGCSAASIGSRYGIVSNCAVTLKPTLANAGKVYLLQVTHGSAANASTGIMVDAAIQGGSFKDTNGNLSSHLWTSAFQQSNPNIWKTIGRILLNPGVTQPIITFTTTNKNLTTSSRFYSDAYRLTLNTTTILTASTNLIVYGHPVTFTAKVTGTESVPSGIVTFYKHGDINLGTAVLDGSGMASLYVTNKLYPPDNPNEFIARYEGNVNLSPSVSDPLYFEVWYDDRTIELRSSMNPSATGTDVTITSTITGTGIYTPTGTIDFYDGDTVLGSGSLNGSGVTTFTITNLSVGDSPHAITVNYTGDAGFEPGTSAPLLQSVMDPPVITTHPSSLTKIGGTTAVFSVGATGTAPLSYYWMKNGVVPVSGTNNVLNLPSLRRSDSGLYRVAVSNLVGTAVSEDAFLTVHVPQRLASPTLLPDGSVLLTASDADGGLLSSADLLNFEVQRSTNLVQWTLLPDALTLTNGVLHLQGNSVSNDVIQFYRIIENW
ncbi:MAG: hypothetical protein JWM68_1314 [Verrucomicrobiales bacterium]|nr:hypothetical protein [Verrucomicrobiales bacterium]